MYSTEDTSLHSVGATGQVRAYRTRVLGETKEQYSSWQEKRRRRLPGYPATLLFRYPPFFGRWGALSSFGSAQFLSVRSFSFFPARFPGPRGNRAMTGARDGAHRWSIKNYIF